MSVIPALAAPYAAYVMDARTGEVLYQENADTPLNPASLTKMMTLYITFQAIEHGEVSLDTMVTVSREAASEPPSKLGLRPGQKIALRYLIRAAAIKSANDAATALAEAIGGSVPGFADRMNRTAKQLGMNSSHFVVPHGLTTAGHLSSAHDLSILGRHLFYDYPQYYNIFSRRSADAGVATVYSTNRRFLNAYDGADGIKTGYTVAAGFNLTASAHRGNKRIVATLMGGQSTAWRNQKMADLLDMGFKRAPDNAPVQKPAMIAYLGPGGQTRAATQVAAAATPAGNVSVAASLRPAPRPGEPAPTMTLAMQDGIDAAIAQARAAAKSGAASVHDGTDESVIEAEGDDTIDPAGADAVSDGLDGATKLATASSIRPPSRPRQPGEAPAIEVAGTATPLPAAVSAEAAALERVAEATAPAAAPAGKGGTATVMMQTTAPQPETLELAQAMQPAPADAPPERPGMIMLMSSQADTPATAAPAGKSQQKLEVVSRASTSGGRGYGISIGQFNSRYSAERALLQMALTEPTTLDGTLRKVVTRATGYDANFVGMTEEMAQAACRRLDARGHKCAIVGP